MTEFTPLSALLGGALIGVAAVLLLRLNGRIAGISGIFHGSYTGAKGDRAWRVAFVLGLVAAGAAYRWLSGEPLNTRAELVPWQLLAGGLLVGFGTRLGSGCTSGHGVCGIARLSPRSLVATGVFLALGMATATTLRLTLGSGA